MSACYQTTDVQLGNSPGFKVVYLQRPIMPFSARKEFAEDRSVKLTRPDGTVIMWFVDGSITLESPNNGDFMTWDAKPTIADAVHSDETGTFYQFHADGSVDYRGETCFYSWSKELPGVEEIGEIFFDHECGSDMVWDDECTGLCHRCRRCEGGGDQVSCPGEHYGYESDGD